MTTILCFGDSITRGAGDSRGGWVQRLRESLESQKGSGHIEIYNLGIDGDRAPLILKRFAAETEARVSVGNEPIVIFAVGVNDAAYHDNALWTPKDEFTQAMHELLRAARTYTSRIVVVGLTPVDEAKHNPAPLAPRIARKNMEIREYDSILRKLAAEVDTVFVDIQKEFLALPDYAQLLPDGLHPNGDGHALIAASIEDAIAEANKEKRERDAV